MANKKISQLTDGTSFQSGDEAVVNRSGTNYKVDPTQFGSSIDVTGTVTADGLSVSTTSATTATFSRDGTDGDVVQVFNGAVGTTKALSLGVLSTSGVIESEFGNIDIKAGSALTARFASGGDISFYEDTGTTPKFFWDASTERLGIGTISPSQALDVVGNIEVSGKAQADSYQFTQNSSTAGATEAVYRPSTGQMAFKTNSSEAMRIDSSGVLLVGKTAVESTTAGTYIGNGQISSVRDGTPVVLNRLTSDGSIIDIRKDGTTVGSIGANGGTIYAGKGGSGLIFNDGGTKDIIPYSVTSSDTVDNSISLGIGSKRFKDLYLSGGVYLGGTGAANLLDDYETGTWTPVAAGAGSAGVGTTYNIQEGMYTKVGRMVFASFDIELTAEGTIPNTASIGGLPFAVPNSGSLKNGGGSLGSVDNLGTNYVMQSCYPQNNSSYIFIIARTAASDATLPPTAADFFSNSARVTGWVWYQV